MLFFSLKYNPNRGRRFITVLRSLFKQMWNDLKIRPSDHTLAAWPSSEWFYSLRDHSLVIHHSASVLCDILHLGEKKKHRKSSNFSALRHLAFFLLWPRRDLYLKELTRLSISTLEFLKIMDVPFLHTRTFQCSSYIYNAKLAIIFWLSAISSVKISKQTHFNLHFCIKNEKTQTF